MSSNNSFANAESQAAHRRSEAAAGATQGAGEQIAQVAGQAQQMAHQQFDNLAETIRRSPLQAAGIAAGIGFVLALMARR